MKKLICLISTVVLLAGLSAQATTLNEWSFYSDPAGKTLSNAFNSAGTASFALNSGYNDASLRTDGFGSLVCTNNDTGTNGMWTSGAVLDATTGNLTSGTFFLRYDFAYDLNATNNNSGTLLGFAFTDATGAKVAGADLQYDLGAATAPTNLVVTQIADLGSNYTGNISIITKVDMAAQKLAVWYDLTGTGTFTAESSPQASNITVNLPSINKLRLQATGDFTPAGSDDFANINLLRMTDSFTDAAADALDAPPAKYSNEWTFERDANGRPLSDTINSGTNNPLAQFGAGFGTTVFTTNRALRCIGNDAGSSGVWTNGAILNATLPSATSGVHYLRYDVAYDLSSTNNNSGTLLGVYFTDSIGDKAAGLVLGYEQGNLAAAKPANRELITVASGLALSGTLTAIAEVNLDTDTLRVWYDLSGSNTFNTNSPAVSTGITLSTINNLRFHATGDFRPAGSTDYAEIDNIRHAASLSEIIDSPVNLTAPPKPSVSVSNSSNGAMDIGETNIVTVVIRNSGGPATNVTSTLAHNGASSAFTVVSNNAPGSLGSNASLTNTYILTANSHGAYNFTIQAVAGTNSVTTNFNVVVGSRITYLTNTIAEISGGILPGKYEPGETISITVVSTNNGARTVTNIVNTLSANPAYFTISPASATYPSLAVGRSASTVYTVAISNTAPGGIHTFSVTNRAGSMIWVDSFTLDVFRSAIPSVAPGSLTLNVVAGTTNSAFVTVTNRGNAPLAFTVSDNGTWGSVYSVNTNVTYSWENSATKVALIYTNAGSLSPLDYGYSTNLWIGFDFPLNGKMYDEFFVTADGAVGLGTNFTYLASSGAGQLPSPGGEPVISPFWRNLKVGTNSITYRLAENPTRLIISYTGVTNIINGGGGGTNLSFQTILYTDGSVKFQYKAINGAGLDAISCGVQGSRSNYVNTGFIPASGKAVLISPEPDVWVSRETSYDTVPAGGSANVIFTANATGRTTGTTLSITNLFTWLPPLSGSTSIVVTVNVIKANPVLTASPTNVVFSGQAGASANSSLVISNSGNVSVDFTISDTADDAVTYTGAVSNDLPVWDDIRASGIAITNWIKPDANRYTTAEDEGFSPLINIGFEFDFFGSVYTQLSVGVNGGLSLGSTNRISAVGDFSTARSDVPDRFITPYWGDLQLGTNSKVRRQLYNDRFVVSWINMQQRGIPTGTNLTFQAVLYKTGDIEFRYQQINGGKWSYTPVGLRNYEYRYPTRTITTNIIPAYTNYVFDEETGMDVPDIINFPPDGVTPASTNITINLFSGAQSVLTNLFLGISDTYTTTNFVGGTTNLAVRTNIVNSITNRSIRYVPGRASSITYTPTSGHLPVGGSANIVITGDATGLNPGGTNSIISNTRMNIAYASTNKAVDVRFTITNSMETALSSSLEAMDTDGDGISDDDERLAGTDPLDPNSMFIVSSNGGTRTLNWGYADGRLYTVWYTTSLSQPFKKHPDATGIAAPGFTDLLNQDQPAVFYKVTVE